MVSGVSDTRTGTTVDVTLDAPEASQGAEEAPPAWSAWLLGAGWGGAHPGQRPAAHPLPAACEQTHHCLQVDNQSRCPASVQSQPDVALYYTVDVEYYSGQRPDETVLTTGGAQADDTLLLACDTVGTAQRLPAAAGESLVVRCPADCGTSDTTAVYSPSTKLYLRPSSVCRAAVHAGLTATQPFKLTLSAGTADANTQWITSECTQGLVTAC